MLLLHFCKGNPLKIYFHFSTHLFNRYKKQISNLFRVTVFTNYKKLRFKFNVREANCYYYDLNKTVMMK